MLKKSHIKTLLVSTTDNGEDIIRTEADGGCLIDESGLMLRYAERDNDGTASLLLTDGFADVPAVGGPVDLPGIDPKDVNFVSYDGGGELLGGEAGRAGPAEDGQPVPLLQGFGSDHINFPPNGERGAQKRAPLFGFLRFICSRWPS